MLVKEDPTQERFEEAVNDSVTEAFLLRARSIQLEHGLTLFVKVAPALTTTTEAIAPCSL